MIINNCIILGLSPKVYCNRIDLRSLVVKLAPFLSGVRLCIAARPGSLQSSKWKFPRWRDRCVFSCWYLIIDSVTGGSQRHSSGTRTTLTALIPAWSAFLFRILWEVFFGYVCFLQIPKSNFFLIRSEWFSTYDAIVVLIIVWLTIDSTGAYSQSRYVWVCHPCIFVLLLCWPLDIIRTAWRPLIR